MKKVMKEADRKNLEADKIRRYRAAGMNETDAAAAAKKDVRTLELSESRRTAALDSTGAGPAERQQRRKELYMRSGMSAAEAEIAARGRGAAG